MARIEGAPNPRSNGLIARISSAVVHFFRDSLWQLEREDTRGIVRVGVRLLQVIVLVARNAFSGSLTRTAYALTAVSLLSVVPLLAVVLVAAKGFGLWQWLKDEWILPTMGELGHLEQAADVVLSYVENTNFARLGFMGAGVLFFTAISMLTQIERAMNGVWGVRRGRTAVRRFTDYTAILVLIPFFLAAAAYFQAMGTGFVASLLPQSFWTGTAGYLFSKLLSYLLFWVAFSFLYLVMPNRKVPLLPAIGGGILAGTMYRLGLLLFVAGQVGVARYNAIYSGIAALPLTIVWIYVSWIIALLGCEFAFALHHFKYFHEQQQSRRWSRAGMELLGLRILVEASFRYRRALPPPTVDELGRLWVLPESGLEKVVAMLTAAGLVHLTAEGDGLVPALPDDTLTLGEARSRMARLGEVPAVRNDAFWQEMPEALRKSREGMTLGELVDARAQTDQEPLQRGDRDV